MYKADMAQNNSLSDAIDDEAVEIRADAHPQNYLPGNNIALKTTWPFFKKEGK